MRNYIKYQLSIILICCFAAHHCVGQSKNNPRPNIIIIMADDLGWRDVGFMGSTYYETPNIDKLANDGIFFTDAYAAAANCAPSRACMISGQNTPRHGIYTVGGSDRGKQEDRKLIPVANTEVLADSIYTMAEALKAAGYNTGTIGKWHLGKDPKTQGFDYNFGGSMKGANKHFTPYKNPAIKDGPEGEYLTDRIGSEAIAFLGEQGQQKPFFMYVPFYAVHTPIQAPDSLVKKYKAKSSDSLQNNPVYAAMIESLDTNVGRILKKLDELGLSENTLIIFTSDNGGIRKISRQDPLRAGKGSYYEGGIRVPLAIKWPGQIEPNSKSPVPVINMDFYPTFLDIINAKTKPAILDGKSILPVLKGSSIAERPFYWHFPIYLQAYDPKSDDGRDPLFRTRPGAAIRLGDWKLHLYYEDNKQELYNLKEDLGERKNVVAQHPEIAKKLHSMLLNWQSSVNAPLPKR